MRYIYMVVGSSLDEDKEHYVDWDVAAFDNPEQANEFAALCTKMAKDHENDSFWFSIYDGEHDNDTEYIVKLFLVYGTISEVPAKYRVRQNGWSVSVVEIE